MDENLVNNIREKLKEMDDNVLLFHFTMKKLKQCPLVVQNKKIRYHDLFFKHDVSSFIDERKLRADLSLQEIVTILDIAFRESFSMFRDYTKEEKIILDKYGLSSEQVRDLNIYQSGAEFYDLSFKLATLSDIASDLLKICKTFMQGLTTSQQRYIDWYHSTEGPGFARASSHWGRML